MLFLVILLITQTLLSFAEDSFVSSDFRLHQIEYSTPSHSTFKNEHISESWQHSSSERQETFLENNNSNNVKSIQETLLMDSAFVARKLATQSTLLFYATSTTNRPTGIEPKIADYSTTLSGDHLRYKEETRVSKKQDVSIGQRKSNRPAVNFKTMTSLLTENKNTDIRRKLVDYDNFTVSNSQSKDSEQKFTQIMVVETNTIAMKQPQTSEILSKKISLSLKKQVNESSRQPNVSVRVRPSTARVFAYRGDLDLDISRNEPKKSMSDFSTTETVKNVDKKRLNKGTFNSTLFHSVRVTTPDAQMNDPPFVRGPHISSDLDMLEKGNDLTEKTKYLKDIEDPSKFKSLKTRVDWRKAKKRWGYAWELHCYIIGALFTVVAVYCLVSLLRVKTFARLLGLSYYVTTNLFVLIMCLGKIFYLLYDPYNSTGKQPAVLSYLACDVMYPCMVSSFAVLFSSLLQSTNIQFLPKFQKLYVLSPVIAFYFSFCITCDIIVGVFNAPNTLLLACQIMYFILTLWLSGCYCYVYRRVYYSARRKQGEMIRITFTKMHITGSNLPKKLPKPSLALAVRLTLATTILQTIYSPLLLSGMFFVRELFPNDKNPNPWLWWCHQLFCRIFELLICATMCFTATLPLKHFDKNSSDKLGNAFRLCPCRNFAECYKKVEAVDFEEHSDNYANLQGFRNCDFKTSPQSRKFQTNSLPTFRTPLTETTNTLPMRHAPYAGRGRNTNHPSVMSLLSYYRSKRNLSLSANERLNEFDGNICNNALLSSLSDEKNVTFRPTSMLYKDKGFIRFRRENDPEQPMEMSDEDRIPEDDDTSSGDADSTKADVGSSFCSVLEDDIVHCTASPFYHTGYSRRFRKLSRISTETTDNSVDLSSDQLSHVGFRNGVSGSVIDFNIRKYGSTCSSESAANSFDVTFFLNGTSPMEHTLTANTTPVSVRPSSSSRSETEEEKTSSVEGHEIILRSISPIVKRAVAKRVHNLPLDLNLSKSNETGNECERVNIACGTEDITPDSAVYLDIQFSKETALNSPESIVGRSPQFLVQNSPLLTFTDSPSPSSDDTTSPSRSTHVAIATKQPPTTATSQSLVDLRTRNSYVNVSGVKRSSGGFFYKLRGSAFSLNAATNGYEPLEAEEGSEYYLNGHYHSSKKTLLRAHSDSRPHTNEEIQRGLPNKKALQLIRNSSTLSSIAHLGDSGLLDDCKECAAASVDAASQTDWPDIGFAAM